jgi:hypothetical protein
MVEAMPCGTRPTRGSEAWWKPDGNAKEGVTHREADNGGGDGFESGGLGGGFRRRFGPRARQGQVEAAVTQFLCERGQRKGHGVDLWWHKKGTMTGEVEERGVQFEAPCGERKSGGGAAGGRT